MLKDWVGDGTAIKRITVQHRGMDVAGNTLTTGGKLTRVSQKGSERRVECEVWVENQHGQRTAIGTASLIL
jgi:acyl dehydratase